MTALVEARFAGGPIWVGAEVDPATGVRSVTFRALVTEFPLRPSEARLLGIALIEYAAAAETEEVGDV